LQYEEHNGTTVQHTDGSREWVSVTYS